MAILTAKIGDIVVGSNSDILEALALGSCVAVIIYDETTQIAGMAHVLLPKSLDKDKDYKLGKYADTAIPELIKRLIQKGAKRDKLKAKIVGGAKMFEFTGKNNSLDVGKRNAEAVKKILVDNKIKIVAEDIGENYGRTVHFDPKTATVSIRFSMQKLKKTI